MAKQPAKGRKTPARPKKTPVKRRKAVESPKAVIDAIPPEVHAKPVATPPSAATKPVEALAEKPKPAEKPGAAPKTAATPGAPPKPTPEPKPDRQPTTPPARQGGFIPLVLGGLIAGVIGFGVATLTTPAADGPLADQVASQSATIAALEQQIGSLETPQIPQVDLSAVEGAQAAMAADIATLQADIAALNTRIDELPTLQSPSAEPVPGPDIAAYEAEIDALRAEMQDQLVAMTETAQSQLEQARAEAASIEQNAAAAARNAAGRAALARVQTGLESGAPLGAALDDLQAALAEPVPDALAAVRDGVPTLASLQESFPDLARAALATARSEGVAGEETSGLTAFLRNQLDVRSVAPREGNDVDAVLSRAEAAVKAGRLSDAIAELAALPDVARAEMSGWLERAEARASAVMAGDMLATSLNDN